MENKIIIAIIVSIIITSFFVVGTMPLDKKTIPARFILGKNSGFELSPTELTFGKIGINQSAARDITVSNTFGETIIISIESSGEISKNLIVSENKFRLEPNESKNLTFSVYTRGLTEFREYLGEVIIISKRA